MERIFTRISVVERAKQLEENGKTFYERLTARTQQEGITDLFEYLVKRKERHHKSLDKTYNLLKDQKEPVSGYEDKFSLYVAPSIESWVFTNFDKKVEEVDLNNVESSVKFMIEFEKEALLFYYGLKEILPQSAVHIIDEIVNQRRDDILALQNLIKDLEADIDDLLFVAMHSELMAKRFYEDASNKAQSQAGKKLFHDLANFEHRHFRKIEKIIESRNRGIKLEPYTPETVGGVKPEVEGEFEPNKDEIVDVLILGIKAEKNAQERYKRMAEMTDNPLGKEIFEDLAEAESIHQKVLEDEFYSISNKGTIIWGE